MKKSCPECGSYVEARYVPSLDGLGVLPYAFQVLRGAEHDRHCRHFVKVTNSSLLAPTAEDLLAKFKGSHGNIKIDDSEREAACELVARCYAQWGDYELLDRANHLSITNGGRKKIGML